MELIPVEVECHAGYKADEYPTCFFWDRIRFDITEILDRWYQSEAKPEFPAANYFKVRTASSGLFILKQEVQSCNWYLVI
jgi:hypothetical protein